MSLAHEQWHHSRQLIDQSPRLHSLTGHKLDAYPSPPVGHPRLEVLIGGKYKIEAGKRPRKMDYAPNTPPIWDQSKRGTCTAHGVTRVVCSRFIAAGREPVKWLSREFAFWAAKQLDGMPKQDGSTSWAAFQGFVKYGCPPDLLDLYNPMEDDLALTAPSAAALKAALQYRIPGFYELLSAGDQTRDERTLDMICNALWLYGPAAIAHLVCSNFQPDPKTGVIPLPQGSIEGGHEECIVGYDDDAELLKIANSWSEKWGFGGYWFMPYKWITGHYDPTDTGVKAWYVYDSYTTNMQPVPKQAGKIVMTVGSKVALVDSEQVEMDQAPELDAKTNRSLVPDRFLAGNTGYVVGYDAASRQITFTKAG